MSELVDTTRSIVPDEYCVEDSSTDGVRICLPSGGHTTLSALLEEEIHVVEIVPEPLACDQDGHHTVYVEKFTYPH